MKHLIPFLLTLILLTACTESKESAETTSPTITESIISSDTIIENEYTWNPTPVMFQLYTPNIDLDRFEITEISIEELTAENILGKLKEANVLNEDVNINNVTNEDGNIHLDFNTEFSDQLLSYGTAGERYLMGSLVNTFLSAYGAETATITVNGELLESGHVVYDFPMELFK